MDEADSLVLGQVLVHLDVAPCLAAAVNAIDLELGRLDIAKIQAAEDVGSVVDEEAEGPRGGGEVQDIVAAEVGDGMGEHQRVREKLEKRAVLDVTGQTVARAAGLGHRMGGGSGRERETGFRYLHAVHL